MRVNLNKIDVDSESNLIFKNAFINLLSKLGNIFYVY